MMQASAHSQAGPVADVASAPITIRQRPRALLGGLLLAIASVWLAASLGALRAGGLEALFGPGPAGAIGTFAIGAVLALAGLGWIGRCRTVVLDQGRLRATERGLTGGRVLEESLARYHGLRVRRQQLPHRYGRRSWYVLEAWHREPAKTVELARSKDPRLAEQWAEDWARRLGLPLCHEPEERHARADASLRDRPSAEAASDQPMPAA
jgi:hypothetical protein